MKVNRVSERFEKMYGKKAPYCFVFESGLDGDLIISGSSLLKIIKDYLSTKAQKSLLKLDLGGDFESVIRGKFNLNGLEIGKVTWEERFDFIYRFSFLTTFQYLNEKKQFTNHIYVHEGAVINNFDLKKYKSVNGDVRVVKIPDLKMPSKIAREKLKELLEANTKEISRLVSHSLDGELNRVRYHYSEQINEIDRELKEFKKKIDRLENELKGASDKRKEIIVKRIERLKESIEKIKESDDVVKLEREKEFYMDDERHKHALNISNDIINTAVIYYPILKLKFSLRGGEKSSRSLRSSRLVLLDYNPLTGYVGELGCDSCGSELREIWLCDSGHLLCRKCLRGCPGCMSEVCDCCEEIFCDCCKKKICKNCVNVCGKCRGRVCDSDICTDYLSGKKICSRCANYCPVCKKFTEKEFFKRCSKCGREVCPKCFKVDVESGERVCGGC